jgi:zinc protease
MFAPGDAALDLVADLLANGRTSRLYRTLIFERRVATDVSASQGSRELGGLFQIAATAAPGHSLDELNTIIAGEIARLSADGPTEEELERGRVQAEASFVYRLQTLGGFGGKADQLNAYNIFVGQPDYFDEDLARYLAVQPDDLAEAARILGPERCTALSVVPPGQQAIALPGSRVAFQP